MKLSDWHTFRRRCFLMSEIYFTIARTNHHHGRGSSLRHAIRSIQSHDRWQMNWRKSDKKELIRCLFLISSFLGCFYFKFNHQVSKVFDKVVVLRGMSFFKSLITVTSIRFKMYSEATVHTAVSRISHII